MNFMKGVMKKKSSAIRQFEYEKGKMKINLSVDTDIKTNVKDLIECLEAVLVDLKAVINVEK